jgi:hypothetical protein
MSDDGNPLYRSAGIGHALTAALADVRDKYGTIPDEWVENVWQVFDKVVTDALLNKCKTKKVTMDGRLETYNNRDEVWSLYVTDCTLRVEDGAEIKLSGKEDTLKIVAWNLKPSATALKQARQKVANREKKNARKRDRAQSHLDED